MGKVNACLKRSYVIVVTVIGTYSAMMLFFTLFNHGFADQDEEDVNTYRGRRAVYIVSSLTLISAIIGVFGADKEKKWALIVFAVGMILSTLVILFLVITGLLVRPQIIQQTELHYLKLMKTNLRGGPTDDMDNMQILYQCCGLEQGYTDWGYNIPDSCMCTKEATKPCVAAPENTRLFKENFGNKPVMIYKEPCLQHITNHIIGFVTVMCHVMMGVLVVSVVAIVLCFVILCQLSRRVEIPAVVYNQETKASSYNTDPDSLA